MSPRRQGDWLTHQLSEFLAGVSAINDEATARQRGIERLAEAVEAEVGAMIVDDEVAVSVGFRPGSNEAAQLVTLPMGPTEIDLPSLGAVHAAAFAMDDEPGATSMRIVLVRADDPFSTEEQILVRGMARVLRLTLWMLGLLESERSSRAASDRQAAEKEALLESLRERQLLLERLFEIQRSISHRAPSQVVLDSITRATAELLRVDVAAVRLIDEHDPEFLQIRSVVGVDADIVSQIRRSRIGDGIGGQAVLTKRLVEAADYGEAERPHSVFVDGGLGSAMAAPVHRDGAVVGSLVVARYARGAFSETERQMLLALAEHTSLALNDSSALEAVQRAYDDAVHRANHDELTGLPNRALVLDRIETAVRRGARSGEQVTLLFIDLDRFKSINDSLGHSVGDEVLITVASRLAACVRGGDTVGRLSGDEFVVVCDEISATEAMRLAERVANALAVPIPLYGRDLVLTASIGIATGCPDQRAEDVIRDADVAMYRAKEQGIGRVEVFDESIRAAMLARIEMEHDLRLAIAEGDLRLHYQPVVDTDSGETFALEALVRWQHRTRGLLAPDVFIPLAEDAGLIVPLGRWVLSEACRQIAEWQAEQSPLAGLRISVNLSARQFADPGLVALITGELAAAGVPASSLGLEITESVLMEEAEVAVETLRLLKQLGVHLAIDDFGTGYSSLAYLQMFPVDAIKIDRSFVWSLDTDRNGRIIVDAIVSLARALGLDVVAEGVETESQLAVLRGLRCGSLQGYLFSAPRPPETLIERIRFETTASSASALV